MYKSIIDINKSVPKERLPEFEAMANKAFDNRAGKAQNASAEPYRLIYEGGESKYGCLELGMLALEKEKNFMACVSAWQWVDEEDPGESCDILEEIKSINRDRALVFAR